MSDIDELLSSWADSEDGSLFDPRSIQEIRDRIARAHRHDCHCHDTPHENALHDLVWHDLPALLRLVERLRRKDDHDPR